MLCFRQSYPACRWKLLAFTRDYVRESINAMHGHCHTPSPFRLMPEPVLCTMLFLVPLIIRVLLLLLCYASRMLLQSRGNACLVGIMCGAPERIAFTSGVAHVERRCDDCMCVVSVIVCLVARQMLREKERFFFFLFFLLRFFFLRFFWPFFFSLLLFCLFAGYPWKEARLEQKSWRLSLPHKDDISFEERESGGW